MSGVRVIGALLNGSGAMLAAVPAEQIKGGGLPQGTSPPALVVTRVTKVSVHALRGKATRIVERVQVTGLAANFEQLETILLLAEAACDGQSGAIGGAIDVDVVSAGAGPDFQDEDSSIWMSSIDFRVSFRPA